MRMAVTVPAVAAVLAGPAAIAFFAGGYFDQPRLVAGLVACALTLAAAAFGRPPLPRRWPGRLALAGLAGLAAWTALSVAWAPLGGQAADDAQRLALYALALCAAAAWLRAPAAARAAEPVLLLGTVVVIGYGLSERMLPGVLDFDSSAAAGGRLEQPLTYWNAMGAVAVLGLVLAARLAGSGERPRALRALGAAAVPTLAAGHYLTFSRGALAALAAGAVALLALAPERAQLRAGAVAVLAGGASVAVAAALPDVHTAAGDSAGQGLALLAGLAALSAAAALAQALMARREASGGLGGPALPRRRLIAVTAVLGVLAAGGLALAATIDGDGGGGAEGRAGAARLRSLESYRYDYWRVALASFADNPLAGTGTAGFRVEWQRERGRRDAAVDAHSLYLETLGELGLVGFALLMAFMAGVVASARRALAVAPALAAGPAAALVALAVHAGFDWDWELPAVTLSALALAGLLVAAGDGEAA
jgi:hypothetical protein